MGFGNLVRQSIQKHDDLLQENEMPNLHHYTGVVISKQDRSKFNFTLHETEYNNPNEWYTSFAFFSSDCTGAVEGADLLCMECKSSVPFLKQNCIHLVERENVGDFSNTRKGVLLSPPSLVEKKTHATPERKSRGQG